MRSVLPGLFLLLSTGCSLLNNSTTPDDSVTVNDSGTGETGDTVDAEVEWVWTPVLINFDELSGEPDVATVYPDVTFSSEEEGTALYAWEYASYSRSEPYTAYTARSAGGAGISTDLTFDFTDPVRALQFYSLGDQTNGTFGWVEVTMEDGSTASVDLVGDGSAGSAELCDLSAYENVTRIVLRDITDPNTVNLDDISFEVRGL
ncbi:MAG: hypothetical protein ACI9VR_005116 [Cognaticolwellia sp.]